MNTTLSVICFTETLKCYHELNEVLPQIIVVDQKVRNVSTVLRADD